MSDEQTATERPRFICEHGHNIVGGGPDERCTVPVHAGGDIWTNPWPPPDDVMRCGGEMEWELVEPGAVAAEREACAGAVDEMCDDVDDPFMYGTLRAVAAAIRNRGEAT